MPQQPPLSQAQPSSLAGPEPHSFPMLKLLLLQEAAPTEGPQPSPSPPPSPVRMMLLWQRFPSNYISCTSPAMSLGCWAPQRVLPTLQLHCGIGLPTQTFKKPSRAQLELQAGQGLWERIQH